MGKTALHPLDDRRKWPFVFASGSPKEAFSRPGYLTPGCDVWFKSVSTFSEDGEVWMHLVIKYKGREVGYQKVGMTPSDEVEGPDLSALERLIETGTPNDEVVPLVERLFKESIIPVERRRLEALTKCVETRRYTPPKDTP